MLMKNYIFLLPRNDFCLMAELSISLGLLIVHHIRTAADDPLQPALHQNLNLFYEFNATCISFLQDILENDNSKISSNNYIYYFIFSPQAAGNLTLSD